MRYAVCVLVLLGAIAAGFALRAAAPVPAWENFESGDKGKDGIGMGCKDAKHTRRRRQDRREINGEVALEICVDCIEDYEYALAQAREAQDTPLVFKRDGVYYVYVFKDSPYFREFGYYGKRSYGDDRARALAMFTENFPGVPVPDVLLYDGDRDQSARACPFIMHDGNPCASRACAAVDWSKADVNEQKITPDCGWSVNQYCHQNAGRDPACACWDTSGRYYNTKYCREFRSKFNGGRSGTGPVAGCKVDLFDISEHPDLKEYIRKDAIPCFNCAVDSPVAGTVPESRKWENTPGARELLRVIDDKIKYGQ